MGLYSTVPGTWEIGVPTDLTPGFFLWSLHVQRPSVRLSSDCERESLNRLLSFGPKTRWRPVPACMVKVYSWPDLSIRSHTGSRGSFRSSHSLSLFSVSGSIFHSHLHLSPHTPTRTDTYVTIHFPAQVLFCLTFNIYNYRIDFLWLVRIYQHNTLSASSCLRSSS